MAAALLAAGAADALTSADVAKKFGVSPDNIAVSPKPVFMGKFHAVTDQNGSTIFVSDDLRYAVQGLVIDHKTGNPIVAQERPDAMKFNWSDLDKSNAIQIGTGKTSIAIFADPSCGYCKRLERELASARDDFTVYIIPVAILGPESAHAVQRIWCAKDRADAWTKTMTGEAVGEALDCSTPIGANQALMQKHGIGGTPGIILPNGEVIPGFVPVAELKRRIRKK